MIIVMMMMMVLVVVVVEVVTMTMAMMKMKKKGQEKRTSLKPCLPVAYTTAQDNVDGSSEVYRRGSTSDS